MKASHALAVPVLLGLAACYWMGGSPVVNPIITVTLGETNDLILAVNNRTTHVLWFENPAARLSRTRFDWDLVRAGMVLLEGGREPRKDPLLPAHVSSGPIEILPGKLLEINLSMYLTDLASAAAASEADLLLWRCRIWDQTSKAWTQATGSLALRGTTRSGLRATSSHERNR